ncbi:MAG: nitroreductase family protein [Planctomycetota bacterium]
MDIYETIKKRRSIRKYKPDPIPDDKFNRIMEAVRLAPSGKNGQPWRFVIVRDNRLKEELVQACKGQTFMAEAPVIIAACGSDAESYQKQGGYMTSMVIDVSIALDHLTLAATAEGLATCWIGAFSEPEVKKLLNVPDNLRVVALTPLGWPAEEPPVKSRKSLKEIMFFERFPKSV